MWHVCSPKPKRLKGDHNGPIRTRQKNICVSWGMFTSFSMLQDVAVQRKSCNQNPSATVSYRASLKERHGQHSRKAGETQKDRRKHI